MSAARLSRCWHVDAPPAEPVGGGAISQSFALIAVLAAIVLFYSMFV